MPYETRSPTSTSTFRITNSFREKRSYYYSISLLQIFSIVRNETASIPLCITVADIDQCLIESIGSWLGNKAAGLKTDQIVELKQGDTVTTAKI